MKRTLFFAILMAVCAISTQAQLEVESSGKVSIGTSNFYSSLLQIGTQIDTTAAVTIANSGCKTSLKLYKLSADTTSTGIYVKLATRLWKFGQIPHK